MNQINFGCQFYTWQMSGKKYIGKLPHILKVVNAAGFAGIEPETLMLGAYYEDPQELKDILIQHGLKLGAITLVLDWAGPVETKQESQEAELIFKYTKFFPGTHLVLCQMPGKDRTDLQQRQANAIACVNAVAVRAFDQGIFCSFHPNSPLESVFRTRDDYRVLLDGLDSRVVGFAPDSGHIAKGGMDVIEVFQSYMSFIKHVHFKDITASGEWAAMGAGVIDFPQIVTMLKAAGYNGWIMIEEESPEAEINPDIATNKNGKYLHQALLPIIQDLRIPKIKSPPEDNIFTPGTDSKNIQFPSPNQVHITGCLSPRFQGNIQYLINKYEKNKDWMLEPFQHRGEEWVIEPLRNKKGERQWAGEYAGKWLDAASLTAASSSHAQLGQYSAAFAAAMIAAQDSDGYLGIEIPARRGGNSEWDLWNVKYALTGLLTRYEVYCDKASLDAAIRGGEWVIKHYGKVADENSPFFHSHEDGGVSVNIIDEFVRLYRFTGERRFLEFASSVVNHFPPVVRMQNTQQAPLVHAYNLLGYLGSVVELFAAENAAKELRWIEEVWEDLVAQHLYPTGSLGYNELLRKSAPNDTPVENGQPERHHQETCATVEWLLFNARLYLATGRVRYVEKMEHTIYNALRAAQSADGMKWMYYTPLRYEKRWFTGPTSCCYWSGPRGIARLPGWVYALDGEGIRVNLYESSEANLQLGGHTVAVRQSSLYPDDGRVTLLIQPEESTSFALRLRIPFAGSYIRINLNGLAIPSNPGADGYVRIQRTWSAGDKVEMEFGIPTAVEHFLDDRYGILVRGAEVLSVDQRDNPALDLDHLALPGEADVSRLDSIDGRRRYASEMYANGRLAQVVATPYAESGGEGSRFRTAFPIYPR
ncbi:MAG: glycoside hydrolase family 127 protein [Anaerolineales bacterium]|nr:glycoside hydrolase family 127 protein [Anaerolineales bacterium]